MSQWRLKPMLNFRSVTFWILFSMGAPLSFASDTSTGPTSKTEATLLWGQGKQAFEQGRYGEAVAPLKRLIHRYPAIPNYIRAHYMLGVSQLHSAHTQDAVKSLRYYISSIGSKSLDAMEARLPLGWSYLELKKSHEAQLTSQEILDVRPDSKIPAEIRTEALVIKAEALLQLKHADRARQSLDSALKVIPNHAPSHLHGVLKKALLNIKLNECTLLPSAKALDEAQALNQFGRRGLCLNEAAILYHDALKIGDPGSAVLATQAMKTAFDQFNFLCNHPPQGPGKRTAREQSQYARELLNVLLPACSQSQAQALELLKGWEDQIPTPMKVHLAELQSALST